MEKFSTFKILYANNIKSKRLIKAMSPQLQNFISNENALDNIYTSIPDLKTKYKQYSVPGYGINSGSFGFIGYESINRPDQEVKLYVTDFYQFTSDNGENKITAYISYLLNESGIVGSPYIGSTNSDVKNVQSDIQQGGFKNENLGYICYTSAKTYEEGITLAEEQICKQFKDVVFE